MLSHRVDIIILYTKHNAPDGFIIGSDIQIEGPFGLRDFSLFLAFFQ
jgi:hypothetical protein